MMRTSNQNIKIQINEKNELYFALGVGILAI